MSPKNPVCPSCYRPLDPAQMTFLCRHIDSATGSECGERFVGDGRNLEAFCPKGHPSTRIRVCSYCRNRLPPLFGRTDARLIAMMGATNSGKTVYLTTLMREWNDQTGDKFQSAVMPVDDSTTARYAALRDTLTGGGQLDSTRSVEPYVFTIDLPGARNRTQKITCSFLDSPGEDQGSAEKLERYSRYVASADGIILLLDPVDMDGAEGYVEAGQRDPLKRGSTNRDVVDKLVQFMLDFAGTRERPDESFLGKWKSRYSKAASAQGEVKLDVPVAVVVTKIDAVQRGIGDLENYMTPGHHDGFYDTTNAQAVDGLVRGLIRTWDGPAIENKLTRNFKTVRFFAASSLGHPTEDGRVSRRGWQPRRVADPLLWLLAEFGVIDSRAGQYQ